MSEMYEEEADGACVTPIKSKWTKSGTLWTIYIRVCHSMCNTISSWRLPATIISLSLLTLFYSCKAEMPWTSRLSLSYLVTSRVAIG